MNTIPQDQHNDLTRDAAVDALLHNDAAAWRDIYIDNDGFSERVMAKVHDTPAPRVALRRRMAVVGASGLIGAALVVFAGGGANLLIDAAMDLATRTITPAVLALGVVALATAAFGVLVAAEK